MSLEDELFRRAHQYVERQMSLVELYTWVMDQEPYWGEPPEKRDAARELVGAIYLACFEHFDGDRDEESVRGIVAEELARLTEARSRT